MLCYGFHIVGKEKKIICSTIFFDIIGLFEILVFEITNVNRICEKLTPTNIK